MVALMKELFIDASLGIAGDMLTAALLALTDDESEAVGKLNALGIPKLKFELKKVKPYGISGNRVHVTFDGIEEGHEEEHHHEHHGHHHGHMHAADVNAIINSLDMPERARERALATYRAIAEAETTVHGEPMDHIHFHEVGSMDAIADVCAVCCLIDFLGIEHITVSPVRTGYGQVRCAHGMLPVPAPATALLLRGMPSFAGDIEGEMCTPTGVALLKTLADDYGYAPAMVTEKLGYGMGMKDFGQLACTRVKLGQSV